MLDLSSRDRCFVIAEAGTCHADEDPMLRFVIAANYIAVAAEAGADAVKFQWFHDPTPETMFCWMDGDEDRETRWQNSVLGLNDWAQLKKSADDAGIMLLASTFEHETVRWLSVLGIAATKVASRAAEKFPYIGAPEPFLISTGLPDYRRFDKLPLTHYLECEAHYPSTAVWRGLDEGFSDHSGTPWRAIDAISRGCKLIEVHFYIDETDAGPDLSASLDLDELKLVCDARDAFAELRRDANGN